MSPVFIAFNPKVTMIESCMKGLHDGAQNYSNIMTKMVLIISTILLKGLIKHLQRHSIINQNLKIYKVPLQLRLLKKKKKFHQKKNH